MFKYRGPETSSSKNTFLNFVEGKRKVGFLKWSPTENLKKRKISDFFAPLPKKITRTYQGKQAQGNFDDGSLLTNANVEEATRKTVSSNNNQTTSDQATQTEFFEVHCNQKEGLKFLAERIYNFESKRIHGSYELCSIADKRSYPKTEQEIINKAHYNMDLIQEHETQYFSRSCKTQQPVEMPASMSEQETTHLNHKMTCWGEENPDIEFLNGMKFMAYRIRKTELSRLDYDECTSDWQYDWQSNKPIDLINEVASTMVGMRKLKNLLLEDDELSDLEDITF